MIASEEIQKKKKLLLPRKSLPLKIQQEMKVKQIIYTPAGECVLDFGQNISGILSFRCKEKSGKTIHLYFGEILQDGNFYNENLRTAKQEFTYISDGKERTVRQHFTFYGFRYVKVKGISDVAFADFTVKVLYSDMEVTGHVCTSNIKVNRLFQNAMWGQKGNFIDTPTDCPQRDERMGWTGDAQMFCATASYNMYTPAFFDKYLFDMLKEQRQIQGAVPFVVPDILGRIQTLKKAGILNEEQNNAVGMEPVFGSSAWGDAAVIIPWNMYLFYGDKALLKKQFDNMRLWIDYIQSVDETDESGGRLWKRGFHFGDWLALDSKEENSVFGGTDPYFIASAYYKLSSELTAKAAGILGYSKIEEKYSRLSEEVKRGIWLEYFCESEHWENLTQTACVLALYFDLVPNKNRGKIIHVLKDKLDERGGHLSTGFVGTPYLCPALCEGGLSEYAYTLLLNEDYPGWLYEVNMGATTIWERWNSVLPNGKISDTGMNSLNHYAYGSIVEWMYKYMCGIVPVPEHTGFRHTLIRPFVDRRLRFAQAEYLSVYGKIFSRWEQTARGWELTLQIPMDTSAELVLAGELSRCRVSKVEKMAEKSNGHISNECIFAEQKKTSQPKYILTPGRYRISLEYENEQ